LNNLHAEGAQYIAEIPWKNLLVLNIRLNKIHAEGCKYLRRAQWRQLQ
jgi:hypothetical protein